MFLQPSVSTKLYCPTAGMDTLYCRGRYFAQMGEVAITTFVVLRRVPILCVVESTVQTSMLVLTFLGRVVA